MDRTIHICSHVDVAGGRGRSPGVAGGRRRRRRRRRPNNSPIWPEHPGSTHSLLLRILIKY